MVFNHTCYRLHHSPDGESGRTRTCITAFVAPHPLQLDDGLATGGPDGIRTRAFQMDNLALLPAELQARWDDRPESNRASPGSQPGALTTEPRSPFNFPCLRMDSFP